MVTDSSTTTKAAATNGDDTAERCSVEEVALVVPETDDPNLPVMTFRAWVLGVGACVVLMFLNTFFIYRTQPLSISAILMQIAVLPLGRLMAATLPEKEYRLFGQWGFTLNPGPFNIKEHVIITVMANCGVSTGGGDAYSIGAITVMKGYYKQSLNFLCALLIVLTTQVELFFLCVFESSKFYLSSIFGLFFRFLFGGILFFFFFFFLLFLFVSFCVCLCVYGDREEDR